MIIYGFIDYASPDYDLFLRLRYNVLRKPLGLDYSEDQIIAGVGSTSFRSIYSIRFVDWGNGASGTGTIYP
jgi:hypothetical protein